MTDVAASASCATSAAIAARIASWTSEPIRRTSSLIWAMSWSRPGRDGCAAGFAAITSISSPSALRMMSLTCRVTVSEGCGSLGVVIAGSSFSSEPPGHVVLGELVLGVREDLQGFAFLDDVARPVLGHVQEDGPVRGPCGLLHVVGHDDDRVLLAELRHE